MMGAALPAKPDFTQVSGHRKDVSLAQRVFAREWVWTALFYASGAFVAAWIASLAYPDYRQVLLLLVSGAIAGAVAAILVVKTFRFVRVRLNGGPFRKGDVVQVIEGPHADTIGVIYEEWPSRDQVRVALEEELWRATSDVFTQVQITKAGNEPIRKKSKETL